MSQSSPELGGFSTCLADEQGQSQMPGTKAVYTPLIDTTPSDPTIMLTTMVAAHALTKETWQVYTVFTANQQLYWVMVNVICV